MYRFRGKDKDMKVNKRVLQAMALVLGVCMLCIVAQPKEPQIVQIEDEQCALSGTAGTLIEQTKADTTVIPDKYNTGCSEALEAFDGSNDGVFNGIPYSVMNDGETINLYLKNLDLSNPVTIRDTDFTGYTFLVTNSGRLTQQAHLTFENCKFDKFRISGYGMIDYTFNNCSFASCTGYDMTMNNCYFGGASMGDGLNPMKNVTVNNSFFSDLVKPAADAGQTNHIDGTQMFGINTSSEEEGAHDNENIHYNNCRFEVPYLPYTYTAGAMNCVITFTLNYGAVKNISFEDIYVNGGTYYTIAIGGGDEYEMTDVSFKNVYMGGARKSNDLTGNRIDDVSMDNVVPTSALYVGSVWKDNGIHLSVSNDTNVERTLKVVTNNGEYTEVIPACPVTMFVEKDSMHYEDLPFDIDITVPDADWVVAYDITDNIEQIRYVNWTTNPVYVEQNWEIVNRIPVVEALPVTGTATEMGTANVLGTTASNGTEETTGITEYHNISGSVSDTIVYTLSDGTLTLSGTGAMPGYHSTLLPPWDEYKEEIHTAVVSDGITVVGTKAFLGCSNLTTATMGVDVAEIGNYAFNKCPSLKEVVLPANLTKIGKSAFAASSQLESFIYCGTAQQWTNVSLESGNDKIAAIVVCTGIEQEEERNVVLLQGACGDTAEYVLTEDGVLKISGSGSTYNYHSGALAPWYEYKDMIQVVIVDEGIVQLGSQNFSRCGSLSKVQLPDSLTLIGNNSFLACKSLTEITIPGNVTEIGRYSFSGSAIANTTFNGTEEQWGCIVIGEKNEPLIQNVTFN